MKILVAVTENGDITLKSHKENLTNTIDKFRSLTRLLDFLTSNLVSDLNHGVNVPSVQASLICLCLINELLGMSGHIKLTGDTSYTSQQPWIFPGTFRDNILFSKPFDSCRYQRALQVCCLTEDLRLFGEGDMSLVGERCVTLSGGQKLV
ncbi:Multidrug resistance-associated protein 4 [Oopsacas minuta]|uniref:Multidrug resistance-associated protein 4 n=1 Tax=Oopsacas minuta TaxID=111878 RepID=A0AAV7K5N0_9METZ|nr:Multidrug resistance-associated protein 4 [Oopsacas minuta]